MSKKKKAVTTMTLKDFHGGSIPSELPLPSAPGVSARPTDRPTAAPSPSSVASARPRTPAASSAATAAAAIPSFLTNPSRIGRHFDEDERTPFEPATPRRPAPSPPSFPSAPAVGPARSGPGNAWGAKREVAPAAAPAVPAASGGQIWSATRISQASAVEKVISGRWQLSKPSSPTAPVSAPVLETQVAPPEMERPRSVGAREFDGVMERPGLVGMRGLDSPMDRPRLVVVRELDGAMERPRSVAVRGLDVSMEKGVEPVRPASHEGRVEEVKIGEVPERPKLKLLPRSRPIEAPAPSPTYVEEKQVHPVPVIASVIQVEVVHDVHQNVISAKTGVAGADTESRTTVERPRLNLKPRSNAVGQSGESAAKERFQRKKLLILDLNGILADINKDRNVAHMADGRVQGKNVFKRSYLDDFLRFCFQNFELGIWSSRMKFNVDAVVDILMKDLRRHLVFCWDVSKCTTTKCATLENRNKPLVLKELKKLWNKEYPYLPWEQGEFSPSNTLLVDDSPYKALRNPPYTAIFPQSYSYHNEEDNSLGPGGDLRVYLENIAAADDVQRYVQEHPFGQPSITESDPHWNFYKKIHYRLDSCEWSNRHA